MNAGIRGIWKYPLLFAAGGYLLAVVTFLRPEEPSWYNNVLVWPMSLIARISRHGGWSDYLNQNRFFYPLTVCVGWGIIGLLYGIHDIERRRGVPLLQRRNTAISLGITVVCALLAYASLKPPTVVTGRNSSSVIVRANYSDADRDNAKQQLNEYGRNGIIIKYGSVGEINYVLVEREKWHRLSPEGKEAFIRKVLRCYEVLGQSTIITFMEIESNKIVGRADLSGVKVNSN